MEEKMYLTRKTQVDLLTDPLCLAVMHLIGKEPISKEWIADQLNERLDFIGKCIEELAEEDLLMPVHEEGEVKYCRRARTLEVDKSLLNDLDDYWISGILNHVENEVAELLHLPAGKDREAFFNELGYEDLLVQASSLLLTREELQEFQEMLASFINRHEDAQESDQLKKYGLAVVLYPDVPNLKQEIGQKNK